MVVRDIFTVGAREAQNKAFFAFERRDAGNRGVYFFTFDKSATAITDENIVFNSAIKLIDGGQYGNKNLTKIYLYSNNTGNEVSITITTIPEGDPAKGTNAYWANHK